MKKLKLKKYVLPVVIVAICLITVLASSLALKLKQSKTPLNNLNYVSNTIISKEQAVINTTTKIISPYTEQTVQISKTFYDYKGTAEEQEGSIVLYEDTYMQNTGIDFTHENKFNVISILDGTVINVKEDEFIGKIIEIQHDNDYISVYQSLSEVNVKKGDTISQGHVIGKSGENALDKSLGNHLHFELYIGGHAVNPLLYINKEVLAQ